VLRTCSKDDISFFYATTETERGKAKKKERKKNMTKDKEKAEWRRVVTKEKE
jgi:hypothetical protein